MYKRKHQTGTNNEINKTNKQTLTNQRIRQEVLEADGNDLM